MSHKEQETELTDRDVAMILISLDEDIDHYTVMVNLSLETENGGIFKYNAPFESSMFENKELEDYCCPYCDDEEQSELAVAGHILSVHEEYWYDRLEEIYYYSKKKQEKPGLLDRLVSWLRSL